MICPVCGTENPEGAAFCQRCGAGLAGKERPAADPGYPRPLYSDNPAIDSLKKNAASKLFLAAAICYSASVLLSFIGSFFIGDTIVEVTQRYANRLGSGYVTAAVFDFGPYYTYIANGSLIGALFSMLPSIATLTGLWLLWNEGRDRTQPRLKSAGLTVLRITELVNLVLLIIGAAVFFVAALLLGGAMLVSTDTFIIGVIFAVVGILAVGVVALIIIFKLAIIKNLRIALDIATTGRPALLKEWVGTALVILGILGAISSLSSLTFTPLSGLGSVASSASTILFGVVLGNAAREQRGLIHYSI